MTDAEAFRQLAKSTDLFGRPFDNLDHGSAT